MSIDLQQDFYGLFGLHRRFRIDEAALELAYHDLQGRVHPDRYAHLPDSEKRLSMQWATQVNEGFRTLRKPLSRATYLLELMGIDAGLHTNTAMSPAFLMEQMEWREALDEAEGEAGLEELSDRVLARRREMLAGIERLLDVQGDAAAAAQQVRALMFVERFATDVGDRLAQLGQ